MPRVIGVKERFDLDLWAGWAAGPYDEHQSDVPFSDQIKLATFDIGKTVLSNTYGSLHPSYSGNKHCFVGSYIYASFDDLETYKLFFKSVEFFLVNDQDVLDSFLPRNMILPDNWPKDDGIPDTSFDFGICGHVMFEKQQEIVTHVLMVSQIPFVEKMKSIAVETPNAFARISISLFGSKLRDVQ